MSKFTASNGYRVYADAGVLVVEDAAATYIRSLGSYAVAALREYFQHERDEELGRWRWPENPDYVVYPRDDDGFRVMDEAVGYAWTNFWSAIKDDPRSDGPWAAARAYFEAHPEPKPWHGAKEGELWCLTYEDCQSNALAVANDHGDIEFVISASRRVGAEYEHITAGRRIWPEDKA